MSQNRPEHGDPAQGDGPYIRAGHDGDYQRQGQVTGKGRQNKRNCIQRSSPGDKDRSSSRSHDDRPGRLQVKASNNTNVIIQLFNMILLGTTCNKIIQRIHPRFPYLTLRFQNPVQHDDHLQQIL